MVFCKKRLVGKCFLDYIVLVRLIFIVVMWEVRKGLFEFAYIFFKYFLMVFVSFKKGKVILYDSFSFLFLDLLLIVFYW